MALRKGFGAQLSGANADDIRYDLAGTVVRNSAGVPRSGLFPPVASSLLTPTATMAVGIAAFSGVAVRDNGVVFLSNVGADTVTLTAPPSSNSRLDVIWAKQNDASAYVSTPDANNTPVFGVLTGVASATPVRNPAGLPQGAIELGTVLVPSTATNTGSAGVVITPTFQYTAMAGAAFNVRTFSELPSGYLQGALANAMDSGVTFQYYAVYNASTNPQGAKTAGWYPTPGSDVFFHADRANAIGSPVNATAGIGAGGSLLGSPTYQSQFFSFTTGGLVSPLFEGRYSIRASAQWTASASGGVVQMYVTKNQTTVAAAGNLAGEDGNGGNPASITLKAIGDSVPLLTTDVLRMVNNAISGSIWTVGGNNTPAAAQLDIRWQGVIHA